MYNQTNTNHDKCLLQIARLFIRSKPTPRPSPTHPRPSQEGS
ncbi:hypothetical protein [Okeania sp. SIO2C2]|nr:hypothetical protein [Okeania sp. SIO2C2]